MIGREELDRIAFWARMLKPDEAERARRGIVLRRFPAGHYICHRGDRLEYWTGVVTGLVKISAISASGKAMTFAGVAPGGWFGEGTVLKKEARKYDLVALRETELAMMGEATFDWLYEHSVGFNRYLVTQLNERMGQFIATIEHDRIHDPVARVARNLAWLFNPVLYPNAGSCLEITQEELGLLAGVSRPVTNRALQELEEAGLLEVGRGGIAVLDVEALANYGS
ncbi:MAG: cyclic nucleotide-binding domain-containing protein [Rhizobiales bacterium]|nr:cyclic nucleotide-binding domain-containing protein [Hyphomicrobiales bacterium]